MQRRILVIDDDAQVLETNARILQNEGFVVTAIDNGKDALELVKKADFDLVLSDIVMQGIDGLDVLKEIKNHNPKTMVILITGYGSVDSAITAIRSDATDYLEKPVGKEFLLFRVRRAFEIKKLEEAVSNVELLEKYARAIDEFTNKLDDHLTLIMSYADILALNYLQEAKDSNNIINIVSGERIIKALEDIEGILKDFKELRKMEHIRADEDYSANESVEVDVLITPEEKTVLIIENDETLLSFFADYISGAGYQVDTANKGAKALDKIKDKYYMVVILNLNMHDIDGYEILFKINRHYRIKKHRTPATILLTNYAIEDLLQKKGMINAFGALQKPFDILDLMNLIKKAEESMQT